MVATAAKILELKATAVLAMYDLAETSAALEAAVTVAESPAKAIRVASFEAISFAYVLAKPVDCFAVTRVAPEPPAVSVGLPPA
ncbi:unannotated protein [freshwater metagenome]|uniref:Unannotated protein n=1 Tax=freshwater metagenome TaxID=449393 RepID=A0A6J6MU59_9ZZZZ